MWSATPIHRDGWQGRELPDRSIFELCEQYGSLPNQPAGWQVDRRLYMPESWMEDSARLAGAGVPAGVEFQTKPQMALEMIQEATSAEVPYKWVSGDCAYGDYRNIRLWLEANEKCYVMCVSGKEHVWLEDQQVSVSYILKSLPADGWFEESCGDGSKGERLYDWQAFEIESHSTLEGWKRVMLVRRSQSDYDDMRAHTRLPAGRYVARQAALRMKSLLR